MIYLEDLTKTENDGIYKAGMSVGVILGGLISAVVWVILS
jgi:hypothetical protein